MKIGVYIMAPQHISTAYFINSYATLNVTLTTAR
jgi:hypothetical protein